MREGEGELHPKCLKIFLDMDAISQLGAFKLHTRPFFKPVQVRVRYLFHNTEAQRDDQLYSRNHIPGTI